MNERHMAYDVIVTLAAAINEEAHADNNHAPDFLSRYHCCESPPISCPLLFWFNFAHPSIRIA